MKITLSIFSFLLVLGVSAQSSKENAVWSRVEALNKAIFQTKDSAALDDLVSKKLTYGHSGGNLEDKPTMIHNAVINQTVYKNPVTERLSIIFVDDDVAVLRHIFRATQIEKGTESSLNLGILQVWCKEKGRWKIVARQAVKVPPKS